ncbi:hypothetical protein D5S17_18510 [Pseudonocardiaceae bacterium YIM PH 21723]|nr:hypothetical protein D5S17_18510 [Pseudonocardiaceae bacterium YIM PH 21723]
MGSATEGIAVSRVEDESANQRLARNTAELLQELRVAQTGVQILFAFLLVVPFSDGYEHATEFQRVLHVVIVLLVTVALAFLVAPVAWHRMLFRRHRRQQIVNAANGYAIAGLVMLSLATTGTVALIVDVALGHWVAGALAAASAALFCWTWFLRPFMGDLAESAPVPDHDAPPGQ